MATTKKRLNITLTPDMEWALGKLAKRDRVPEATKASELLLNAMIVEEDSIWARLADARYKEKSKHINHKQAWGL